jgi:hypothetical protein
MVAWACHPSYGGKLNIGGSQSKTTWTKKREPISKITKAKRAGNVTQVVECLLSKLKALSSNSILPKKGERGQGTLVRYLCYTLDIYSADTERNGWHTLCC